MQYTCSFKAAPSTQWYPEGFETFTKAFDAHLMRNWHFLITSVWGTMKCLLLQLSFTPAAKVLVTTSRRAWVQIKSHLSLSDSCQSHTEEIEHHCELLILILSDVCLSVQLLSGKRSVWMGAAGCLMKRREVRGTRLTAGGSVKERRRRRVSSTAAWSWGKSAL